MEIKPNLPLNTDQLPGPIISISPNWVNWTNKQTGEIQWIFSYKPSEINPAIWNGRLSRVDEYLKPYNSYVCSRHDSLMTSIIYHFNTILSL